MLYDTNKEDKNYSSLHNMRSELVALRKRNSVLMEELEKALKTVEEAENKIK